MQEDMKEFVTSQPAAGALFVVVLGELCDFSVATFRQKTERYAEGGRDGGLTRATVRAACRLPAEDVALPDGAGHRAGVVETVAARQVPGWLLGDEEALVWCHVSLVKHCLERLGLLLGVPRQQVAPGRVAEGAGQGPCVDPAATEGERVVEGAAAERQVWDAVDPAHPLERGVLDLFPPVPDGADPVAHRETLSADPCVSWCGCVAPTRHLTKLHEACDAKANHRGCGVMNAMDVVEEKEWAAKAQKYQSHLAWMTAVRQGRGCRNGQHGRPHPVAGRDNDREPRALPV